MGLSLTRPRASRKRRTRENLTPGGAAVLCGITSTWKHRRKAELFFVLKCVCFSLFYIGWHWLTQRAKCRPKIDQFYRVHGFQQEIGGFDGCFLALEALVSGSGLQRKSLTKVLDLQLALNKTLGRKSCGHHCASLAVWYWVNVVFTEWGSVQAEMKTSRATLQTSKWVMDNFALQRKSHPEIGSTLLDGCFRISGTLEKGEANMFREKQGHCTLQILGPGHHAQTKPWISSAPIARPMRKRKEMPCSFYESLFMIFRSRDGTWCEFVKGIGRQVEVILIKSRAFVGVCEAVWSFWPLSNKGIGVGNLSVLGCLWALDTFRCAYICTESLHASDLPSDFRQTPPHLADQIGEVRLASVLHLDWRHEGLDWRSVIIHHHGRRAGIRLKTWERESRNCSEHIKLS